MKSIWWIVTWCSCPYTHSNLIRSSLSVGQNCWAALFFACEIPPVEVCLYEIKQLVRVPTPFRLMEHLIKTFVTKSCVCLSGSQQGCGRCREGASGAGGEAEAQQESWGQRHGFGLGKSQGSAGCCSPLTTQPHLTHRSASDWGLLN